MGKCSYGVTCWLLRSKPVDGMEILTVFYNVWVGLES